jgi:hypothetical protein
MKFFIPIVFLFISCNHDNDREVFYDCSNLSEEKEKEYISSVLKCEDKHILVEEKHICIMIVKDAYCEPVNTSKDRK